MKLDPGYEKYDEGIAGDYFAKTPEGEVYVNAVWPGDSVYPDFGQPKVRKWWAENQKFLTDIGVAGVWNDMNEPASFHGELPSDVVFTDEDQKSTHAAMHNVYGHLMSKATYEVVEEVGKDMIPNKDEMPPRQIEFAKLYLTNVVTGKRYIKRLVEEGIVDGWDDPRLVSIAALRRRGFTPESIKMFVDLCGISKANSSVDYAMLEYCIREDLKLKKPRMMAILDPVKVVIDNYPEGQMEYLDVVNNLENEELGSRKVPFGREIYIDREDFMEEPPKKYFRMFPGNEVRLMNAYFVTCNSFVKDENGKVTEIHCTYDPASRGGNSPDGRKVKGTIQWVSAEKNVKAEIRLYENIVDEEKGVYNEDGSLNLNPNSLTVLKDCYVEENLADAKAYDSFQFVRQGFFCVDAKDSTPEHLVFNRIVSLKSSFKLPSNN